MLPNFIKAILPSSVTNDDPLICKMADGSSCPYHPMSLNNYKKITSWVRKQVYPARKIPALVDTPRYDKKLAVLVPYRNREQHIPKFFEIVPKFLNDEHISHEIVFIEQADDKPFNRAKLLNIGASKMLNKADYFCFHDIDFLPETSSYAYINHPVCLINSATQYDAAPPKLILGGVFMIRKEDFLKINGFSNNYWHWGCEDEDFFMRCLFSHLTPLTYSKGRYISQPHELAINQTPDGTYHKDPETIAKLHDLYKKNEFRAKQMRRGMIDFQTEGFNTLQYELIENKEYELYTKISVKL